MKLQEIIKKDNFGFLVSLGAVIVQAVHSQYVLTLVSSLGSWAWLHSSAVAFLISGAIMYFTLKKRKSQAIFWAVFEIYMNICYYSIFILNQEEPPYYLFFIAIPSAIALPIILASFAEELIRGEALSKLTETHKEIEDLKKDLISNKEEYNILKEQIEELKETKISKGLAKATSDGVSRTIRIENV